MGKNAKTSPAKPNDTLWAHTIIPGEVLFGYKHEIPDFQKLVENRHAPVNNHN